MPSTGKKSSKCWHIYAMGCLVHFWENEWAACAEVFLRSIHRTTKQAQHSLHTWWDSICVDFRSEEDVMSDSHKLLRPISPGSAPIRMTSKFYSLKRAEHSECPEGYGNRSQERNIVESFRWKTGWGTEKYFEQWSRWLPCFHVLRISDSRRLEICYAEGQVPPLRFGLSKAEPSAWTRHAFLRSEGRLRGQGTGGISVHFQSKHNSNSEQWRSHPNSSNSNLPCNIYSIHSTWQTHGQEGDVQNCAPAPSATQTTANAENSGL